ncbi:MAG: ECF transporter S component, partial [Clostridiales bacterium]|nr:ECF transporter S component [Clostridiales bacterium]
ILILLVPAVIICGYFFGSGNGYYITAGIVAAAALLVFFISFERGKSKTREITAVASMTAVAVVSRSLFYMLPEIKLIGAVVIIAAVGFGWKSGFLIGSLSMFLSNILFGQGIWTPFQMLGLGLSAAIAGIILSNKKIGSHRILSSIIGGIVIFIVYGGIVDTSSVLIMSSDLSVGSVAAVYLAGMPYNGIFAVTTAVLLALFGKSLSEKLERVKVKYGIFENI